MIDYQDLKYFQPVPSNFFWRNWKKYGMDYPDSFCVSYHWVGASKGYERFYIFENLYEELKRNQ